MATVPFIIDCHICKAKVAASETGRAENTGFNDFLGEPYGHRILIGHCPRCETILVGESHQISFAGWDAEEDAWSAIVRVFPKPPRTFASRRIPRVVVTSLTEADRSLQADANIAACAMLGRALEAVCRDVLEPTTAGKEGKETPRKPLMLSAGIKRLRQEALIDERLFNWSQELHAFRNLAAHPEDISISRADAEDLQAFVYSMVEYIYDLSDRYERFRQRASRRAQRSKTPPPRVPKVDS